MANSVRLLRRYVWLVDTLRREGRLTLDEINRRWQRNCSIRTDGEAELPARTFHRHREAIAEIFDIEIACDRFNGNTYYIANPEALDNPGFTAWLFNGLAIDNILLANDSATSRIIFEESPGGSQHMAAIVEAIAASRTLRISYRRFGANETAERTVEPYGLKQSNRRWYLLARNSNYPILTVYALDRIEAIAATDGTFTLDPTLDIHPYFNDVIGVTVDSDYACEPITLRVYGPQRAYIESRPLHASQQRTAATTDYSDYTLHLCAEYEFQRAILALGPDAEILSPAWLRDEIKSLATATLARYCTDTNR